MSPPVTRPTSLFAASALCLTMLALGSSTRLTASTSLLASGSIAPSPRDRMIARQVGSLLEEAHFNRQKINDTLSPMIMDKFIDSMDSQRSYFLAADIAEFETQRQRFDDMIHTGDIEPAYAIFARYQKRNRERVRYAMSLLAKEPDFTLTDNLIFDREKNIFAKNTGELNELWRQRVKNDSLSLILAGKSWSEARTVLNERYERVLKRIEQTKSEEVLEVFLNAYTRNFDPHSNFFSPRNSEEYKIQMSLNYDGIGATLQLADDYVTVVNLIEGGTASTAGSIKPKDRITAVGQDHNGALVDVIGWRIDDVVQLIRGKGGTIVRLQILPAGAAPGSAERTVELTRGKVTLESQAASKETKITQRGNKKLKIGVISVPGFYSDYEAQRAGDENFRSTTRDVKRLIEDLSKENIDGLVIDLRGDGGGFLPEAQSLTGLFINEGPVVQVKLSNGEKEILDDPDKGVAYDGPLVVLIDRFSASASEIFAGAIQDYKRGLVVGQRSFGKGTVQSMLPLSRWNSRPVNGQITVTIGKFYRITGESTQHRGVEPDIALASPLSLEDVGESALPNALPWDQIEPAPFLAQGPSLPDIAQLSAALDVRISNNKNYKALLSDIAALNNLRKQKTISLNISERRAEYARLENDRLTRENDRRALRGLPALKALTDIESEDTKPKDIIDAVLEQTVEIISDVITATPLPLKHNAECGRARRSTPTIC
ncbi:MAG: tail-specific protease [Gammaproteobacteria bacterium]|nr:tail-specific protease [Gammaproteobacteria bacterium]